MDESVARAMQRWPDVPRVYGWLRLDRRGRWRVKMPHGGFEPITHAGVIAFIGRNYECDAEGRWYFQNGPQRVFVALDATPWIYRLQSGGVRIETHTGLEPANVAGAWLTDEGGLVLATELGAGLLHDRDLVAIEHALITSEGDQASMEMLETGSGARTLGIALHGARIPLGRIAVAELAARFGFNPDPQPAPGEAEC